MGLQIISKTSEVHFRPLIRGLCLRNPGGGEPSDPPPPPSSFLFISSTSIFRDNPELLLESKVYKPSKVDF